MKPNFVRVSKDSLETRKMLPAAKDYKTEVFHKNYRVDDLKSLIEPTPEQSRRRSLIKQQLEAQEKARAERRRAERNRKHKIALS